MNLAPTLAVVAALATFCPIATGVAAEPVDFAHEIVPILRKHCGNCHTGDKKEGGYSMNSRGALVAGGDSGAGINFPLRTM